MELFGASTKLFIEENGITIECDEPIQPFIDELKHVGFSHDPRDGKWRRKNKNGIDDVREICSFYFSSSGKNMTPGNRKLVKLIEDYYSDGKGSADIEFKKTDEGVWAYSHSETYGKIEDMAEDIRKMRVKIIAIRNGRRVCFNR